MKIIVLKDRIELKNLISKGKINSTKKQFTGANTFTYSFAWKSLTDCINFL